MTAAKNMAKYYKNARTHLLAQKPQATQNEINNNPYGREASELAHEVAKLAESWDYDGLNDEGNDWENNYPFQLEVPPAIADNNCMMNEKKDEKTLSQIMEEMAVDWKEFADCMPTSYEVYDDGRDEDVN